VLVAQSVVALDF